MFEYLRHILGVNLCILQNLLNQSNALALSNFWLAFLKLLIIFAYWASVVLNLPMLWQS